MATGAVDAEQLSAMFGGACRSRLARM
jgi:hypothetical protein